MSAPSVEGRVTLRMREVARVAVVLASLADVARAAAQSSQADAGAGSPPAGAPQPSAQSATAAPGVAPADAASTATSDATVGGDEVAAPEAVADAEATPSEDVAVESGAGLFDQSVSGGADEAVGEEASQSARYELGGYVRSDVFAGKGYTSGDPELQAGYSELALELDGPRQEYGAAHAEARLRYGQQLDERDLVIDLREAYVDLFLGPVDLRLGQQIIVWGRADAFNPTNNLMPLDFRTRSPVEDDRRVGNLAARAHYDLDPVRLEGVWIPLYTPTQYPRIELDQYIVMLDPQYPGRELDNGTLAARVHLQLASLEGSVSYVHGHAPLPGLSLRSFSMGPPESDPDGSPLGADPPEVRIARTAYPQHVFGFDFSTAISDQLAVRAEAAYRLPVDYGHRVHAARPDLQYVLGADRSFGPVSVILQYMGRYVRRWKREDGPDSAVTPEALLTLMPPLPQFVEDEIISRLEEELAARNQVLFAQTERVQHAVTARVEWLTLHETLSLSALGMVNFSTEEWLLFPKVAYDLSDALTATVGAEIYVGPSMTLIDLIDHRLTAAYAELRYGF